MCVLFVIHWFMWFPFLCILFVYPFTIADVFTFVCFTYVFRIFIYHLSMCSESIILSSVNFRLQDNRDLAIWAKDVLALAEDPRCLLQALPQLAPRSNVQAWPAWPVNDGKWMLESTKNRNYYMIWNMYLYIYIIIYYIIYVYIYVCIF
jgi:hypothetical protein